MKFFTYFLFFKLRDGYDTLGGESDEDTATKPLTRAELENRVLEGVKKREADATKDSFQFELAATKAKSKK